MATAARAESGGRAERARTTDALRTQRKEAGDKKEARVESALGCSLLSTLALRLLILVTSALHSARRVGLCLHRLSANTHTADRRSRQGAHQRERCEKGVVESNDSEQSSSSDTSLHRFPAVSSRFHRARRAGNDGEWLRSDSKERNHARICIRVRRLKLRLHRCAVHSRPRIMPAPRFARGREKSTCTAAAANFQRKTAGGRALRGAASRGHISSSSTQHSQRRGGGRTHPHPQPNLSRCHRRTWRHRRIYFSSRPFGEIVGSCRASDSEREAASAEQARVVRCDSCRCVRLLCGRVVSLVPPSLPRARARLRSRCRVVCSPPPASGFTPVHPESSPLRWW